MLASGGKLADEYVFLFEDDIMVAPGVPHRIVHQLLACAASFSTQHDLPVFYAGACDPKDAKAHSNLAGLREGGIPEECGCLSVQSLGAAARRLGIKRIEFFRK